MPAATTQNRRVIVVSVPDATVQLLEIVADARDIELGEMASILLTSAIAREAAAREKLAGARRGLFHGGE